MHKTSAEWTAVCQNSYNLDR